MAYDIGFLGNGVEALLPTFGPELDGDIVRSSHLRDEIYADYPTFSLVMNSRHRSAAFVALNIDQSRLGGAGSKSWTFDTRVANNLQLNNDYYRQNVWDRGHMARRASAAWVLSDMPAINVSYSIANLLRNWRACSAARSASS